MPSIGCSSPLALRGALAAALSAGLAFAGAARAADSPPVRIDLRPAPRIALYDGIPRADSNSPVHRWQGRLYAFVSHYEPRGHSYRRIGTTALTFAEPMQPVRIANDPDPRIGKWIESVWRDPSGRLYGWYHAEGYAPCPRDLRLPHLGAAVSADDGLTWTVIADPLLAAPADQTDCSYRNGFFGGGYGDFSVLPDRAGRFLYVHFSSYVADETAQGIAVARYPLARRDNPAGAVEVWTAEGWRPAGTALPKPLWPQERGWRHPDPTGFWGPALHFNTALDRFVMLLNRTEGATGNWRQEGIYAAFTDDPADPAAWTPPLRILAGGDWYPQVVGLGEGDGDTRAGDEARFFMAGASAWTIRFEPAGDRAAGQPPVTVTGEAVRAGSLLGGTGDTPAAGRRPLR
ncbi:MAG: hypothetical protein AB7G39_11120 [Alphaproteobacteria bacterium]